MHFDGFTPSMKLSNSYSPLLVIAFSSSREMGYVSISFPFL